MVHICRGDLMPSIKNIAFIIIMLAPFFIANYSIKVVALTPRGTNAPLFVEIENPIDGYYSYYVAPLQNLTVVSNKTYQVGAKTIYYYEYQVDTAIMVAIAIDPNSFIKSCKTKTYSYGSLSVNVYREKIVWVWVGFLGYIETRLERQTGGTYNLGDFSVKDYTVEKPIAQYGTPTLVISVNPQALLFEQIIMSENGNFTLSNTYLSIETAYVYDNPSFNVIQPNIQGTNSSIRDKDATSNYDKHSIFPYNVEIKVSYGITKVNLVERYRQSELIMLPMAGTQLNMSDVESVNTNLGNFTTKCKATSIIQLLPPYVIVGWDYYYTGAYGEYSKVLGALFGEHKYTINTIVNNENIARTTNGIAIGAISALIPIKIHIITIGEYTFHMKTPEAVPPPTPPYVEPPDITIGHEGEGTTGGTAGASIEVYTTGIILLIVIIIVLAVVLVVVLIMIRRTIKEVQVLKIT